MKPIRTRVAHTGFEENQWFGRPVFAELAGRTTQSQLLGTAVSGRETSPEAAAVLDDVAVVLTDADPRIWPLKLTRLIAAYGDPLPAFSAANLSLHGAFIGHWVCGRAAEVLVELAAHVGDADGAALQERVRQFVAERKRIMGFGVAFRPEDARWTSLVRCIEARGRDRLRHWQLQLSLVREVRAQRNLPPNVASAIGAALLDLGYAPREISALASAVAQNNFIANAVEEASAPHDELRHLPDEAVRYEGRAPRRSPRAGG